MCEPLSEKEEKARGRTEGDQNVEGCTRRGVIPNANVNMISGR